MAIPTIIIPYSNLELESYRRILRKTGLGDPEVIEPWKYAVARKGEQIPVLNKIALARGVAECAGSKPAVILSRYHRDAGLCYPGAVLGCFDSQDDSIPTKGAMWLRNDSEYGNGTFLCWRRAPMHIFGSKKGCDSHTEAPLYGHPAARVESAVEEICDQDFYLSLDLNVFDPLVTSACERRDRGLVFAHNMGFRRSLSFDEVRKASSRLLAQNHCLGINIAEYVPRLEKSPYPTESLLCEYLESLLRFWKEGKEVYANGFSD